MRKKFLIIFIFCLIIIRKDIFASSKIQDVNSNHIGVYTAGNLRTIYEENSSEKVSIASITKIMTAIVCIENVDDLNEKVVVDLPRVKQFYDEDYSVAGLKDKQEVSYYDLIATMLLPSGADSAACIGLNVFGDYSKFINEMNYKAKELGMNNTSFSNTIGSDDINNYSTVYDVAIMMNYVLNNDVIKRFITEKEYTTNDKTITVHNALFQLADIYKLDVSQISGGKTGMTDNAGYCLASYSDKGEETLICVVLGSEIKRGTLFHLSDTQKIYEYINENYTMKSIINKNDVIANLPVLDGTKDNLNVVSSDEVRILLENTVQIDNQKIKIEYSGLENLSIKNKIGDIVGKANIYYDGKYIGEIDVILNEKVFFSIFKPLKDNISGIIVIIVLTLVFSLYVFIQIKFKKL